MDSSNRDLLKRLDDQVQEYRRQKAILVREQRVNEDRIQTFDVAITEGEELIDKLQAFVLAEIYASGDWDSHLGLAQEDQQVPPGHPDFLP